MKKCSDFGTMSHLSLAVPAILVGLCFFISTPSVAKDAVREILNKESSRLKAAEVYCPKSGSDINERYLNYARETLSVDQAISCHVDFLHSNLQNGWIWSSLGSLYGKKEGKKFATLASNCFKQAAKLRGDITRNIPAWHFIGPFVIGKMEIDGDPLEAFGGIYNISSTRHTRDFQAYSELIPHGEISWDIYKPKPDGYVHVTPHSKGNLDWNDLVSSLGSTGITEWQGWVVGDFAVNSKDSQIAVQCLGVHTVYIDKIPITGDVYRRDSFRFSISLSRGVHSIHIRLRAKVAAAFKCTLDITSKSFEVLHPHFLPDLYDGYLFSSLIALPISNLHTSKWLKIIRVHSISQSSGSPIDLDLHPSESLPIAPGQIRPITLQLTSNEDKISTDCSDVDLKFKITTSAGVQTLSQTLRCRKKSESVIFTFLDHDGSIQHGAVIRPLKSCDLCPALLTLHGTSVPAQNQADSYKRMVDGKFVFGVDHAWVLAPTRQGAHNWEGPGALTAITALDALVSLVRDKSWLPDKVYGPQAIIAGHSMGGHGAWHLASHFPDRTLALISLAGWVKKEQYGDSNLFFRHDISESFVDPSVKSVLEACIKENEVDHHISNLQGVPVLTRVGANDRTIHPYYVRRMYRLLKYWSVDVTYVELPDKEHWWWDTREANDGGCVNDKQIRDFTNRHTSLPKPTQCDAEDATCENQAGNKYAQSFVMNFEVTVTNPAFGGSTRGLRVIQQITPHRTSKLKVRLEDNKADISTSNVRKFIITEPELRHIPWSLYDITVDGQLFARGDLEWGESGMCLCRDQTWTTCSDCSDLKRSGLTRGPRTLGPARRVAESKFLIVTGTQGEDSQQLLQMAVYIANLFLLTSDTLAPVIQDTELTNQHQEEYNLIIIGNPQQNLHASRYLDRVPLKYNPESGFQLGSCQFSELQTGALFLAPTGGSPGGLALVLMGRSMEGLRDVVSLATPTIPPMTRSPFSNLVPDFVVTSPNFHAHGMGGYSCTGFWDTEWMFKPELASCSYCASLAI